MLDAIETMYEKKNKESIEESLKKSCLISAMNFSLD
jgi:hypothetical protein